MQIAQQSTYHNSSSLLLFSGRMKTVREKQVYYDNQSRGDLFDSHRPTPPQILPIILTGGALYSAVSNFTGAGSSAISAGLSLPVGATLAAFIQDRKVNYVEKQVIMTPEEEMATMTPLEQAHYKINAALEKWQTLRAPHKEQIQTLKHAIQQIEHDVQRLTQTSSKGDSSEENRLDSIRLKAKQAVLQEHQELLSAAEKVYAALDKQILAREEKLIQGQEQLNMMQLQQGVIDMNDQLEKVKLVKETDTQNEPVLFEMEKQRVQIEALMVSIQQELDVESVLKTMSPDLAKASVI